MSSICSFSIMCVPDPKHIMGIVIRNRNKREERKKGKSNSGCLARIKGSLFQQKRQVGLVASYPAFWLWVIHSDFEAHIKYEELGQDAFQAFLVPKYTMTLENSEINPAQIESY